MNNDSIVRECVQASDQPGNPFRGKETAQVHTLAWRGEGPRLPRSNLAALQFAQPRTRAEMHKLAEEVWRQRGLALIDPLLINDDFARQALINEANRLYGRHAPATATGTAKVQP